MDPFPPWKKKFFNPKHQPVPVVTYLQRCLPWIYLFDAWKKFNQICFPHGGEKWVMNPMGSNPWKFTLIKSKKHVPIPNCEKLPSWVKRNPAIQKEWFCMVLCPTFDLLAENEKPRETIVSSSSSLKSPSRPHSSLPKNPHHQNPHHFAPSSLDTYIDTLSARLVTLPALGWPIAGATGTYTKEESANSSLDFFCGFDLVTIVEKCPKYIPKKVTFTHGFSHGCEMLWVKHEIVKITSNISVQSMDKNGRMLVIYN